jgi:hypothetical protein
MVRIRPQLLESMGRITQNPMDRRLGVSSHCSEQSCYGYYTVLLVCSLYVMHLLFPPLCRVKLITSKPLRATDFMMTTGLNLATYLYPETANMFPAEVFR